jgi:hypothetical protein
MEEREGGREAGREGHKERGFTSTMAICPRDRSFQFFSYTGVIIFPL